MILLLTFGLYSSSLFTTSSFFSYHFSYSTIFNSSIFMVSSFYHLSPVSLEGEWLALKELDLRAAKNQVRGAIIHCAALLHVFVSVYVYVYV
jgi:hypothetical protein